MTIHEASDMSSSSTATPRVTQSPVRPEVGDAELGFHKNFSFRGYFDREHTPRCGQGRMDARRSAPSMLEAWTSAATPQTPPLTATRRAMARGMFPIEVASHSKTN